MYSCVTRLYNTANSVTENINSFHETHYLLLEDPFGV